MTTRDIIQGYFDALRARRGWEAFLSDEVQFTSFISPIERWTGRGACVEMLQGFYSMAKIMEIIDIIVDGDKACVLTRYELQPPDGPVFESHVAEVFEVRDDKIKSFDIYFDNTPFPGSGN